MRNKIVISIFSQALVSTFNFALNLYLIKLWSPDNFGVFSVVSATSILAAMFQNALINTPLAVHLPIAASVEEKALLRRVFTATNTLLTLLLLGLGVGGLWVWTGASRGDLAVATGLFIASQFAREYYRALLAVEGKLLALLGVDASYVLLSALTLATFHFRGVAALQTVPSVLFVLSAWGTVSVVTYIWPRHLPSLAKLPGEVRSVFASQKHEIRWSLLGVITTDIQNRGYLFVAAAFFGPAAVAHLQAGRIFYGPLNLITGSWARVARPQLAGMVGRGESQNFQNSLHKALWAFLAFNLLFLVFLWMAWPYMSSLIFGNKYQGMGPMIAAWGVANIAFQMRSCLGIGVQALRRFRDLTMATIYGAVASVVMVAFACYVKQQEWLIASVIAGECIAILVVLRTLRRHMPK